MRKRRMLFFSLALLILLALLYTGEAIFWWILSFMLSIVIMGALNILYTLTTLSFKQSLDSGFIEKGGQCTLVLELYNNYLLPFSHLILHYDTIEGKFDETSKSCHASVFQKGKSMVKVSMNCPYRGEYEIGFTFVEAVDLFGLFRIKKNLSKFKSYQSLKLVVYPDIYEIQSEFIMNRECEGNDNNHGIRSEEISSISGLRNYREGDTLKHIHWKMSARSHKLLVKEFDGSLASDSIILADCTAHKRMGIEAAMLEDCLTECATAYCKRYVDDGRQFKLVTYSDRRNELDGNSPHDFPALYEHLARIKFQGELSVSSAVELEVEMIADLNSMVLITAMLDELLFERLYVYAENECRIVLVLLQTQDSLDEHLLRMSKEAAMHNITMLTLLPGEDISQRLAGI